MPIEYLPLENSERVALSGIEQESRSNANAY